MISMNLQDSKI